MNIEFEDNSLEMNMVRMAGNKRIPMSGSIELLPLCNMNCDMCYVRLSSQELQEQGRLRSVQEWLAVAEQMKTAGVLFLLLTGGEPLLYPGFRELYCELKKMGMILTVNTNGTLIDEDWAEFFGRFKPRRINITLYGANEETYERLCHYPDGFERAMNGIRLLRKANVDVKISGSAVQANKRDIEGICSIGHQLGVPVTIDSYMMPATRERGKAYNFQSRLTPEEAAQINMAAQLDEKGEAKFDAYRQKVLWEIEHILPETGARHMSCQAGKSSFSINWLGHLQPCVMLKNPSMSVFEHGFAKAWEHVVTETDQITLSSQCGACDLRPVCRSCAACALLEAGSYEAVPDYMCRYARETLRQLQKKM